MHERESKVQERGLRNRHKNNEQDKPENENTSYEGGSKSEGQESGNMMHMDMQA